MIIILHATYNQPLSEVLNIRKLLWVAKGVQQPCSVLDVPAVVADSRIKDVLKTELFQKAVRQDANWLHKVVLR